MIGKHHCGKRRRPKPRHFHDRYSLKCACHIDTPCTGFLLRDNWSGQAGALLPATKELFRDNELLDLA
jgi:hypothetical protein